MTDFVEFRTADFQEERLPSLTVNGSEDNKQLDGCATPSQSKLSDQCSQGHSRRAKGVRQEAAQN